MGKKIGSFGTRRASKNVDDTIEFCGEELHLRRVDGYALTEFTEVIAGLGNVDVETAEGMAEAMAVFSAGTRFLEKALTPESHKRLRELAEENAVELTELYEMAMHLFGWASAFPTEGQSGSSGLPQSSGQNSNDTFSILSQQLNESGTSE